MAPANIDSLESRLMRIPLELRHHIFEHVAVREDKPKKLFRRWFEKKEVKEIVAKQQAVNPNGLTPVPAYGDQDEIDSELEAQQEDQDEEGDGLGDEDDEDDEDDNDIDEDEDQHGNDQDSSLDDDLDVEVTDEDNDIEDQDGIMGVDGGVAGQLQNNNLGSVAATQGIVYTDVDIEEPDDDIDKAEMELENEEVDHDAASAEEADEEDVADGKGGNATVNTQPAQPAPAAPAAPVVRPHHKWRHIPKFLRITHCPPPTSLLLTCKELNREAMDWYYNVAVLRIDATGSFAHTSMFEEALNQVTDAAFSPMENIRKVEVKFVWDTEWIRGTTGVWPEPFEAMLRLRAMCVVGILHRAPQLQEVIIHWFDSVRDNESTMLRLEIVDLFDSLMANLAVEEHYLEQGKKPHRKSAQGQRRLEFQTILDTGCDLR